MANLPETPCPVSATWVLKAASKSFESPFTGDIQTKGRLGEKWVAVYEYTGTIEDLAPLDGFISGLGGQSGRFTDYPRFRDSHPNYSGAALVNGSASSGASEFSVDGFTGTLLAGYFFEVNGEVKQITESITGAGTLKFKPRLRSSVADSAALVTHQPRGKFRLSSDQEGQGSYSSDGFASVAIGIEEVWP